MFIVVHMAFATDSVLIMKMTMAISTYDLGWRKSGNGCTTASRFRYTWTKVCLPDFTGGCPLNEHRRSLGQARVPAAKTACERSRRGFNYFDGTNVAQGLLESRFRLRSSSAPRPDSSKKAPRSV